MIIRWGRKYTRKTDGQPDLFTFAIPVESVGVMKDQIKLLMNEFKRKYPDYELERKQNENVKK